MNSRIDNNNIILPRYISWCLSGKSCIRNHNGIVNFTIDVTKYSASYERDTCISFNILQNGNIKTSNVFLNVGGTGIYKYTCMNLSGNICLTSTYKCFCRRFGCYNNEPVYKPYYKTLTKSSSYVVNDVKFGEIGYNGNQDIYLANDCHLQSCKIFGSIVLNHTENTYKSGLSPDNFIIGDTSYKEFDGGGGQMVKLELTDIGAGCFVEYIEPSVSTINFPACLETTVQTTGANCVTVNLLPKNSCYQVGINVTTSNSKLNAESNELLSLMLDGLSFVPGVSYIASGASTMNDAENLVKTAQGECKSNENDNNNPATVSYGITGGNIFTSGLSCEKGKNLYGSGLIGYICVSKGYLDQSFSLCIEYKTIYDLMAGSALTSESGAIAKEKVDFVPATFLYSEHIPSSLSGDAFYLENEESHSLCRLVENNGNMGFFAEPGTNYILYGYSNGQVEDLENINANSLIAGEGLNLTFQ